MNNPILFKINYSKAIEAIIWLANKKPNIDIYHIAKILFYADKMHINKYARPIIGDTYKKMPYGPVPSAIRDLIRENMWLLDEHLEEIAKSLLIDKSTKYYNLTAKRKPDLSYFSKSDMDFLTNSLNKYGELPFDELYNLTHLEKCYYQTQDKDSIDYALFIDDDNPFKDEILKDMQEKSLCMGI